jgi:hypothetical protein
MSDESKRPVIDSPIDFNMAVLNPVWGKNEEATQELKQQLTKQVKVAYLNEETGEIEKTGLQDRGFYGLLSYYNRDMRLANINDTQLLYCSHFIDLAGDLLHENMIDPFLIALGRSATVLELSQSRGGFLRKRQTTLTTEEYKSELEPKKKSIITGKDKK